MGKEGEGMVGYKWTLEEEVGERGFVELEGSPIISRLDNGT